MNDFNPYAAPQTEFVHIHEEGGVWRDGDLLVLRKGTELPDRCLKCNEPAEGYRLKKTLWWHRAGWYILLLFNFFIYLIVSYCVRWSAEVSGPFCPRHRASRRTAIAFAWIGALSGIGLVVLALSDLDYTKWGGVGACLILASLILAILKTQYLVPNRIDKEYVWLKKVSPDFLVTLPDWHGG